VRRSWQAAIIPHVEPQRTSKSRLMTLSGTMYAARRSTGASCKYLQD